MMSPRDRYQHDHIFRRLVDMLYSAIEKADFTPTEIREAAMLAQIKYEEIRPRIIYDPLDPHSMQQIDRDGWLG